MLSLSVSLLMIAVAVMPVAQIQAKDCPLEYKSFWYHLGPYLNYYSADAWCRQNGYDSLALIKDQATMDAFTRQTGLGYEEKWIGLRSDLNCPNWWRWDDGTCLAWNIFAQPEEQYSTEGCAIISRCYWPGDGYNRVISVPCETIVVYNNHLIYPVCQRCKPQPEICPYPADEYRKLYSCDARTSAIDVTCSYTQVTGTSKSDSSSQGGGSSSTISTEASLALTKSFTQTLGVSATTSHDWRTESTTTFMSETSFTTSFTCLAGMYCEAKQVTGYCDEFTVHSSAIKFVTSYGKSGTDERTFYGSSLEEIKPQYYAAYKNVTVPKA